MDDGIILMRMRNETVEYINGNSNYFDEKGKEVSD